MLSSVSVPLPLNLDSRASKFGGAINTYLASRVVFLICLTPWLYSSVRVFSIELFSHLDSPFHHLFLKIKTISPPSQYPKSPLSPPLSASQSSLCWSHICCRQTWHVLQTPPSQLGPPNLPSLQNSSLPHAALLAWH